MGITIHWEQKDKRKKISEKEARECVDFVEQVAKLAKWKILLRYDDASDLRWDDLYDRKKSLSGKRRIIGISVEPHENCESVVIGFDLNDGRLRSLFQCNSENYYSDSFFCKTQYAGFETHKKVCKLLHAISQIFIPLKVYDDAEYYGIWDEDKSKEIFGKSAAILTELSDYLDEEFKGKVKFKSACKNTKGWINDFLDYTNIKKTKARHSNKVFKSLKKAIRKEL